MNTRPQLRNFQSAPVPQTEAKTSPVKVALTTLHTVLCYGAVPSLLIMSLVLHVHFRSWLSYLVNEPVEICRIRAALWLFSTMIFFARAVRTPRGESATRLSLLLLVTFCLSAGFEAIEWGALLPGFGFLSQSNYQSEGLSLVRLVGDSTGLPIRLFISCLLVIYGTVLPFLLTPKLDNIRTRVWLTQAFPTPRLTIWFLTAAVLYTGYLTPIGEQIGRFCFPLLFTLVALTPRETRLKYAVPDSSIVVLFLLATCCFAAIVFEPYQRQMEEVRMENVRIKMLNTITANNIDELATLLKGADGEVALKSFPLVAEAVAISNEELVQALLIRKASPNIPNSGGHTPLEIAARNGSEKISFTLLLKGADPNLSFPTGTTPLIASITSKNANITNQLLEYGADPNLSDARGRLPLIEAARVDFALGISALIGKGADPKLKSIQQETAAEVAPINSDSYAILVPPEERKITAIKNAAILSIVNTPSTVWSSRDGKTTLNVLSISIRNFGDEVASDVQIFIGDEENLDSDISRLSGPDKIDPKATAKYILTKEIIGEKEKLRITSLCSNCSGNMDARLADF